MANMRYAYAISVVVHDEEDDRFHRRFAEVRGVVEAPEGQGDEAVRLAVANASERAHAGRLTGKVFDDAE